MSIPAGFLVNLVIRYLKGEVTHDQAVDSIMDSFGIGEAGAEEILDGAVEDVKFFYYDDE